VRRNDVHLMVAAVQKAADPNALGGEAVSPLIFACQQGMLEAVQVLVDVGQARLHAPGVHCTPAMEAAQSSGANQDLVEWLVREGVPADACDPAGRTLLHYCASARLDRMVEWLLFRMGAKEQARFLNAVDGSGTSALMLACAANASPAMITTLIQTKAKVMAKDKAGMTAVAHALQGEHVAPAKCLLDLVPELVPRIKQDNTVQSLVAKMPRAHVKHLGLEPDIEPDPPAPPEPSPSPVDDDKDSELSLLLFEEEAAPEPAPTAPAPTPTPEVSVGESPVRRRPRRSCFGSLCSKQR